MESLLRDVRYGIRNLLKRPGFTAIAVITLALGIGANTAIFSVVNAVLLRPLPYVEADRLFVPWGSRTETREHSVVSYPDFVDWQTQTKTLEYIAAYRSSGTLLREGNAEPELITGADVSADLFPMLKVSPALGRLFTRADDQPNAPGVIVRIPRWQDAGLDANVLAFTAAVSILTGLIFGLAPALQASRADLQDSLKESGRGAGGSAVRNRVRALLVVTEVAISLVLLIGAGLLGKSFLLLSEVRPGFDFDHVVTTDLSLAQNKYPQPEQQQAGFTEIIKRAAAIPGVEAASVIYPLPLGGDSEANTFLIAGRPALRPEDKPHSNHRTIGPNYFRALNIPLLRGRAFDDRDTQNAPPVIIINETLARRFFAGQEPLGQHIMIEGEAGDTATPPAREIVGIVGDVRHVSLDAESGNEYYIPYTQGPEALMSLVVRSTALQPENLAVSIRDVIKQMDKNQYVAAVQPMEKLIIDSIARRRFNALLTAVFAAVALLLAAVGIFGVLNYTVAQRTQEIGLRVALGAQTRDVLRLVLGQGVRLILFGLALGLIASLALTRVLSVMLFGVTPTDPSTFVAVSFLLAFVALLACYIPARRAMRVDPLVALRYE